MGTTTVAAPTHVKEKKQMPATAAAPARIPVPIRTPAVWTVPRIATFAALVSVPLIVVSVHPSSGFVLSAIAVQIVLGGLSAKVWLPS